VTYEMMESFWPTPAAKKLDPVIAAQMDKLPKVVFSKSLSEVSWSNTRLVKSGLVGEIRKMKKEPGEDLTIMGSGTLISQLAREGLIDEYTLVVIPVVIGKGRTMFEDLDEQQPMKLTKSRLFKNGNVVLTYEPQPAISSVRARDSA
jgi:dihydrofolate reductase